MSVDIATYVHDLAECGTPLLYLTRKLLTVHRLDHTNFVGYIFDLICLKRSDKMDLLQL